MATKIQIIGKAEELVKSAMKGNDASHDAAHAFRVRDLALSLAVEESLSSSPDSMLIAGQKRAGRRHKFMEEFLEEFHEEWDGRA